MASEILNLVLWVAIIIVALLVAFSRNNLHSTIYLTVFSLTTAALFLSMEAPDVAITEASIGAAISTIFLLAAINRVGTENKGKNRRKIFAVALCFVIFAGFVTVLPDLPEYGSADSAVNQGAGKYYLQNTKADIGIPAVVTATLASYRGYDTLGETYVILCAGFGGYADFAEYAEEVMNSVILHKITKIILPFIVLYGFYILFHGEISPGGGFQGGSVWATALALYTMVLSPQEMPNLFSARKLKLIACSGALIYTLFGIASIFMGGRFLEYDVFATNHHLAQSIGIIGIEIGVQLTVFGVLSLIFLKIN